jgi:hypothetical protein
MKQTIFVTENIIFMICYGIIIKIHDKSFFYLSAATCESKM